MLDPATIATLEHDRAHRPIEGPFPAVDVPTILARFTLRGEPVPWQRPATIGAALTPTVMQKLYDLLNSTARPLWDVLNEWKAWFWEGVRTYPGNESAREIKRIRAHIITAMDDTGATDKDPAVQIGIRVRFFLKCEAQRKDLDNLLKCVCEAVTGTLARDDKQVIEVVAVKVLGSDDPRTEVLFYSCGSFR